MSIAVYKVPNLLSYALKFFFDYFGTDSLEKIKQWFTDERCRDLEHPVNYNIVNFRKEKYIYIGTERPFLNIRDVVTIINWKIWIYNY